MKNNWKIAIAWIATVLVVFIISNSISRNREVGGEVYNARAMEDTVRFYKDKYNREVAEKLSMLSVSSKVLEENDSLKQLIKGMKPEFIVKVNTVYRDTGTVKFDTVYRDVYIPFHERNRYRYISGTVMEDGIHFDNFEVYASQYLVSGKRKKFMGSTEYIVRVVNENPYVTTTAIQPLVIKERDRWYERWWVWGLAGLAGGILISK